MNVGTESGADYDSFTGRGSRGIQGFETEIDLEGVLVHLQADPRPPLSAVDADDQSFEVLQGSGNDADALVLVENGGGLLHDLAERKEVGEKALVLLLPAGQEPRWKAETARTRGSASAPHRGRDRQRGTGETRSWGRWGQRSPARFPPGGCAGFAAATGAARRFPTASAQPARRIAPRFPSRPAGRRTASNEHHGRPASILSIVPILGYEMKAPSLHTPAKRHRPRAVVLAGPARGRADPPPRRPGKCERRAASASLRCREGVSGDLFDAGYHRPGRPGLVALSRRRRCSRNWRAVGRRGHGARGGHRLCGHAPSGLTCCGSRRGQPMRSSMRPRAPSSPRAPGRPRTRTASVTSTRAVLGGEIGKDVADQVRSGPVAPLRRAAASRGAGFSQIRVMCTRRPNSV